MRTPSSEDIAKGPTRQVIRANQARLTAILETLYGLVQGLYRVTEEERAVRYQMARDDLQRYVQEGASIILDTPPQQRAKALSYVAAVYGPRVLAHPPILAIGEKEWLEKERPAGGWVGFEKSDREATQGLLKGIGDGLAQPGPGPYPRQIPRLPPHVTNRQAASVSRSVRHWEQRYQKHRQQFSHEKAVTQTLAEFESEAHFKDPHRKELALKVLKERLAVKSYSGVSMT